MSYAQLTREQRPAEPDGHADKTAERTREGHADELRLAQARRLEILELERATDEGMTAPAPQGSLRADEGDGVDEPGASRRGVEEAPHDSGRR